MSTSETVDWPSRRSGSGQRPVRRDLMATIAVATLLVADPGGTAPHAGGATTAHRS